jgi:hypothetical protein
VNSIWLLLLFVGFVVCAGSDQLNRVDAEAIENELAAAMGLGSDSASPSAASASPPSSIAVRLNRAANTSHALMFPTEEDLMTPADVLSSNSTFETDEASESEPTNVLQTINRDQHPAQVVALKRQSLQLAHRAQLMQHHVEAKQLMPQRANLCAGRRFIQPSLQQHNTFHKRESRTTKFK